MKSLLEKIKNFFRFNPENPYSYTFKDEPPSEEALTPRRYEYIPMPLGDYKKSPEVTAPDLTSMTRAELLKIALEKGIKVSKKANKRDIILSIQNN